MTPSIKFSIVTSTFNAGSTLARTARSLRNQKHGHFEWIVIDGASKDNTLDVARSFGDLITVLVSEPDSGIYSAWNKALPLIRGDWVLFLGAGDELYADNTLEEIAHRLSDVAANTTIAYGRTLEVNGTTGDEERLRDHVWEGVEGGWRGGRPKLPPHQGVLHRSDLFDDFSFDTRCRIAADNEILLRELLRGNGADLAMTVSRFMLGGVSDTKAKRLRMIAESVFINMKVGIFFRRPFYQLAVLGLNAALHVPRKLKLTRR